MPSRTKCVPIYIFKGINLSNYSIIISAMRFCIYFQNQFISVLYRNWRVKACVTGVALLELYFYQSLSEMIL